MELQQASNSVLLPIEWPYQYLDSSVVRFVASWFSRWYTLFITIAPGRAMMASAVRQHQQPPCRAGPRGQRSAGGPECPATHLRMGRGGTTASPEPHTHTLRLGIPEYDMICMPAYTLAPKIDRISHPPQKSLPKAPLNQICICLNPLRVWRSLDDVGMRIRRQ